MPPKQRKITEVLMECPDCPWIGQAGDCDSDAVVLGRFAMLYPPKDKGRLRCPECSEVVKQIGEG